jgi:hypothetical protein
MNNPGSPFIDVEALSDEEYHTDSNKSQRLTTPGTKIKSEN